MLSTPTDPTPYLESLSRLCLPIDGAGNSIERLADLISSQPKLLDDPKTLRDHFADALAGKDLTWPWLEQWRAEFQELQAWPRMWGGPDPDIAFLLHHSMTMCRRREFTFGFVTFSQPLSDEPEPIRSLIGAKIAAYMAGDGSVGLPPYFPGDRTLARPSLASLARRHPEKLICPFLGFGKHY